MIDKAATIAEIVSHYGLERGLGGKSWSKMICHEIAAECSCCPKDSKRNHSTTFLYLLSKDTKGYWHRFQSTLIWSFLAGSPLEVATHILGEDRNITVLGNEFIPGQDFFANVPKNTWQSIYSLGDWSLVCCTHTPGFEYDYVEVAEQGWTPGQGKPKLIFPSKTWEENVERSKKKPTALN